MGDRHGKGSLQYSLSFSLSHTHTILTDISYVNVQEGRNIPLSLTEHRNAVQCSKKPHDALRAVASKRNDGRTERAVRFYEYIRQRAAGKEDA